MGVPASAVREWLTIERRAHGTSRMPHQLPTTPAKPLSTPLDQDKPQESEEVPEGKTPKLEKFNE